MTRVFPVHWLPRGAQALTVCPSLVLVLPSRKDDAALLAHEMVHASQQAAVGVLAWWWRYLTDEGFRLDQELPAYRVQLAMQPWRLEAFAQALATIYRLDITHEEARGLLLESKGTS